MRKHRRSYTAEKIAQSMYLYGQDPNLAPLLPKSTYELSDRLCDACHLWGPMTRKAYHSHTLLKMSAWMPRSAWTHVPLRKRYIRDQVLAAISNGARQVVNIGAGFDVLLLSLARKYPDITFIEIDHPNTSEVKRQGTTSLPECANNMRFVAANLAVTSLSDALKQSGFDHTLPSVFIAEGLLPYLKEEAVAQLFSAIHANASHGSTFIFTYCEADAEGNINIGPLSKVTLTMLKLIGEPAFFGKPAADMERFSENLGFKLIDHAEPKALAQKYLDGTSYTAIERFMCVSVDSMP